MAQNFRVGEVPYKSQWISERRERWGLVAIDPLTVRSALGARFGVKVFRQMSSDAILEFPD